MGSQITSKSNSKSSIHLETTAYDIFGYYGIKRITIEELCKKAGISKSTFYKYFSNKNDLVQHLVLKLLKKKKNQFNQILMQNHTFKEKLKLLFNFKLNEAKPQNKMLLNESSRLLPEINNLYTKQLQEQFQSCLELFIHAQNNQLIWNIIGPEKIVFFLDNFVEMVDDDELKAILPNANDRSNQLLSLFLGGIFNKKFI